MANFSIISNPNHREFIKTSEFDICRLCLSIKNKSELHHLKEQFAGRDHSEIIEYATPLILGENKGLPQSICDHCLERVKIAYELKLECLDTNRIILENYLEEYTSENCEKRSETDNEILEALEAEYENWRESQSNEEPQENVEIVVFFEEVHEEDPQDIGFSIQRVFDSEDDTEIPYQEEAEKTRIELEKLKKTKYTNQCFICEDLPKFYLKGDRVAHFKEFHFDSENSCRICKKFRSKTAFLLNKHMKIHFDAIHCDLCPEKFINESLLKKHKITNHTSYEEKEKLKDKMCALCGKAFIFTHHLKAHIKTHSDNKLFVCSEESCPMKFTSKVAVKRHMLSHGIHPDFVCGTCERGFVVLNELLRHQERCRK